MHKWASWGSPGHMHQSQPGWGSGTDPAPPTPFCSTQVGKILEAAGTWWRCSTISSRCKAPGTSCPRGTSLCSSLLVLEIAQCRSRVNWCIDSLRQVDWINWVKATTTATLRNSLAYCKGYQLSFTLSPLFASEIHCSQSSTWLPLLCTGWGSLHCMPL